MTKDEIARAINPEYPDVYAPTHAPTKLIYNDDSFIVGYFHHTDKSNLLEKENKFTFLEYRNNLKYKLTKEEENITIVEGEQLKAVIYPSFSKEQ
jgi:hypothetical protein